MSSGGGVFFSVLSIYNDDHMPHISQENSNFVNFIEVIIKPDLIRIFLKGFDNKYKFGHQEKCPLSSISIWVS